MEHSQITPQRLAQQGLLAPAWRSAQEMVHAFGAVQAQDYFGAKWAVGQRTGLNDAAVEEAFNAGQLIRTHLLRPTWHFVAPQDIRWLLQLSGPRVRKFNGFMYCKLEFRAMASSAAMKSAPHDRSTGPATLTQAAFAQGPTPRSAHGSEQRFASALQRYKAHATAHSVNPRTLDAATFRKANKVFESELKDVKHVDRHQLSAALKRACIDVSGMRFVHLLMDAELIGLLCSGPRVGKQVLDGTPSREITMVDLACPCPCPRPVFP